MANNELVWSFPDGSYISKERYDIMRAHIAGALSTYLDWISSDN